MTQQTKFERFLTIYYAILPKLLVLTVDEALDATIILYNPNVMAMINLDQNAAPEDKVREYIHYLAKTGPKPFWLTTGE